MTRSASDDDERAPEVEATSELGIDLLAEAASVVKRGARIESAGVERARCMQERHVASLRSFDPTSGNGLARKSS